MSLIIDILAVEEVYLNEAENPMPYVDVIRQSKPIEQVKPLPHKVEALP